MATVKCSECGAGDSVAICSETGGPLCDACAVTCHVCHATIGRERVNVTSRGRKLCGRCMAERNARREAQIEQMRREAGDRKRGQRGEAAHEPATPSGAAAPRQSDPTSFEDLTGDEPEDSTSFSSLTEDEPDLREGAALPLAEEAREEEQEEEAGDEEKVYGPEGAPQEGSRRLELGPIDENRPVLAASGYQPPSPQRKAFAYLLLGIAGMLIVAMYPALRDAMFPWMAAGEGSGAQFDRFTRGPVFLIAWGIVTLYVLGGLGVALSIMRSILGRRRARRLQREQAEENQDYSFPG